MIVNMYVDHMMDRPPASAEEVWNATKEHGQLFADAAKRIGLTPDEYREFRNSLLDGKAVYVRLPRRVDAMSGNRRGSVYAVHNAVMSQPVMGWRVQLADGNMVYVPQACGNISLLRHAAIAAAPVPAHHRPALAYTQAVATVPKETPVIMTPPADVAPVLETPPTVAEAVPAAAPAGFPLFAFIPLALGGLVAAVSHGGNSSTPAPPPCTAGSNTSGVCSK
ncbi:MAG: hypothetical protein IAI50_05655 [Candidatus Eremiobacteraeota bacterium]|nr:hypothetical protein [Candidatus Eremiobacteraeota bacterium]